MNTDMTSSILMRIWKAAMCAAVSACAALSSQGSVHVVATGDVEEIGTNDLDVVLSDTLLVEGTLLKTGAGTLTVPMERIWAGNGMLYVSEGMVRCARDGRRHRGGHSQVRTRRGSVVLYGCGDGEISRPARHRRG